jgi:large subunit ribosomal protein L29
MNAKELRALSGQELSEKLKEFGEDLFKMRFQHATSQLEQTHRIPELKKAIARTKTVILEKQAGR